MTADGGALVADIREALDMLEAVVETDGELHRGGIKLLRRTLERALEALAEPCEQVEG